MKILFGECHGFINELLNAARITLGDGVLYIISNKSSTFNNCHYINRVVNKDLITNSLGITCNSDIEIYVANSSLFIKPQLCNPFRNIRFDIAVLPHECDYKVDAKNIITYDHEYYCGNLYLLYVNYNSAYSTDKMNNDFKNKFLEVLRKLALEPRIDDDYCLIKEMEKLKLEVADLRDKLNQLLQKN